MKYRIMKLINNIKDFFINMKNLVKKFVVENKKISVIIAIILFVMIIGIFVIVNTKSEIGNTSGNLNNSGFSVEKDGWVYYLGVKESNTDGIYRVKLNSNKKEKISSDYGQFLNKSGEFIYYLDRTSGNHDIVKMKTSGEDKETIINDVDTAKITVIDNWIYYFKDSNLYRVKTNGEEKQIISKKSIDNYEIVGNWIYYSYIDDGKYIIAKMKINGDNITKIDGDASQLFFIDNNKIYYIYKNYNEETFQYNYELYTIKSNGKDKKKIADIGQDIHLENTNFNDNRIYYTKTDENNRLAVYSIKLNGKDERKIIEISGYSTLINIHKGWIYYTDINNDGDSQNFRIKTNGKDKQLL